MKKEMIWALMILLVSTLVSAIPVPHGIDGYVYDLDGITALGNVDFVVHDQTSGEMITGQTNYAGYYTVALDGNSGNTIEITVSNEYHESVRVLTLDGVMHGVNLLLNTTLPPLPPTILSSPLQSAIEDIEYSYTIVAQDPNADDLSYSIETGIYGMVLSNNTITFLPGDADVGTHEISIRVNDSSHIVYQNFTLDVSNVNDAPVIVSGPVYSATEDVLYSMDVDATDDDGDSLTYSLVASPTLMVMNASGYISWTPTNDDVGNNSVVVEVSDGQSIDTMIFDILVENTNDAFVINSSPQTTVLEDSLYSYTISGYDIDGDTIVYQMVEGPADANFSEGTLTWVPENSEVGSHTVVITGSDGTISLNQSFSLTVVNVNDAPTIVSIANVTGLVAVEYNYTIVGSDIDGDSLYYSLLYGPDDMVVNASTGLLLWTPVRQDIGNNTVVVGASDGNITVNQTFNISIDSLYDVIIDADLGGEDLPIIPESVLEVSEADISTHVAEISVHGILGEDASVTVSELGAKPHGVASLDQQVYLYLDLNVVGDYTEIARVEVEFMVPESFLSSYDADPTQVILHRYSGGSWTSLSTEYMGDNVYRATSPGFSYFAIAIAQEAVLSEPVVTGPEEQFVLSGIIYLNSDATQVENGTLVTVTNTVSGEVIETQTGLGNHSGAYYAILAGSLGDEISIAVAREGSVAETLVDLEGDMGDIHLLLRQAITLDEGLSGVSGYSLAPLNEEVVSGQISLLVVAGLLIIFILGIYVVRGWKRA